MVSESIASTARPKLSTRARLQKDKITGKPVLLYPEGALMLNPSAHAIVLSCNGRDTLGSIVSSLASRYQVSAPDMTAQVTHLLERLLAKNLLELLNDDVK